MVPSTNSLASKEANSFFKEGTHAFVEGQNAVTISLDRDSRIHNIKMAKVPFNAFYQAENSNLDPRAVEEFGRGVLEKLNTVKEQGLAPNANLSGMLRAGIRFPAIILNANNGEQAQLYSKRHWAKSDTPPRPDQNFPVGYSLQPSLIDAIERRLCLDRFTIEDGSFEGWKAGTANLLKHKEPVDHQYTVMERDKLVLNVDYSTIDGCISSIKSQNELAHALNTLLNNIGSNDDCSQELYLACLSHLTQDRMGSETSQTSCDQLIGQLRCIDTPVAQALLTLLENPTVEVPKQLELKDKILNLLLNAEKAGFSKGAIDFIGLLSHIARCGDVELIKILSASDKLSNDPSDTSKPATTEILELIASSKDLSDIREKLKHKPELVSTVAVQLPAFYPNMLKSLASECFIILKESGVSFHKDGVENFVNTKDWKQQLLASPEAIDVENLRFSVRKSTVNKDFSAKKIHSA